MKKFIIILAILILLAGAGAFFYFGLSDKNINNIISLGETRVFRVGVECAYPPNNWQEDMETESNVPIANREGRYADGYDVQIAKRVADSLGAKLEVRKIPWDFLILALNRGEIDAIFSGMLDTSDRKKLINFSDVYGIQEIKYGVLVHRDSKYAKAKKLTDFAGAKFVGQKDTNLDKGIYQLTGVRRLPAVRTFSDMLTKLLNREVDGIIADYETAGANEKLHHELVTIKFAPEDTFFFDFTGICAGVRSDNAKLLKEINAALGSISKRERQLLMLNALERAGGIRR